MCLKYKLFHLSCVTTSASVKPRTRPSYKLNKKFISVDTWRASGLANSPTAVSTQVYMARKP